jgi:hypothetical protein
MQTVTTVFQRPNIERYEAAYESAHDLVTRSTVRYLLLDEESRYGLNLKQLTELDRRLAANAERIAEIEGVVAFREAHGLDATRTRQTLDNLLELRGVYRDHRFVVVAALSRSPI